MSSFETLRFPLSFLRSTQPSIPHLELLEAEQQWWSTEALPISAAIDRAGTPWVRMFDRTGSRVDEILYSLFRLVAHLAKYWTAEFAVDTAKWAMEVHGGLGTLAEFGVERWLREAMILAIWEGTSHRQVLDGLEVMERKQAHKMLFAHLAQAAPVAELRDLQADLDRLLNLPAEQKEAQAEAHFRRLARFTADHCLYADQQSIAGGTVR